MQLERFLQIAMATMATLGSLLLGMGQRSGTLSLVVMLAAILSVWLTDFQGWLRLNRTVANLAVLLAVLFAGWHLLELRGQGAGVALAIADFLVYVQLVLFFQKKDERIYWQLVMLSLLQVVVAAAFNQRAGFGLLLLVYLSVGLLALALLFVYRERLLFRQSDELPPPPRRSPGSRWPLGTRASEFTGSSPSAAQEAVGRELLGRLGGMVGTTLILTVVLFFTMPRLGKSAWRGQWGDPRRTVGFSGTMTLGELGEIIENPQEVMRIQFFEPDSDKHHAVAGGVYLRGGLLTHYERGQWSQWLRPNRPIFPLDTVAPLPGEKLVRQDIEIEPMDRDELFCVWPPIRWQPDESVLYDPAAERLLRPPQYSGVRLAYQLLTTGIADNRQADVIPCERSPRGRLLELPRDALPGLIGLADRLVAESGLQPDQSYQIAQLLERHLRVSKQFEYSLQGQQRDLGLDPIEDFVTRHPKGHCEYFATALAMMLRSQEIPSRVVVGYHTDEWDSVGKFYQVRQLHAHSWVEAYIPREQLPKHLAEQWAFALGGWLRLEPTPSGSAAETRFPGANLLGQVTGGMRWLDRVWSNYVVEMDRRRQREAIYAPLTETWNGAVQILTQSGWWGGVVRGFRWLAEALWPDDWKDLVMLVGILVVPVTGIVLACWWYWPPFLRYCRSWRDRHRRGVRRSGSSVVGFYFQMETLLARRGLYRPPGETPREFARRAGTELASTTGQLEVRSLPGLVVEAFYRVRFGHHPLDTDQRQAVEQALLALEHATS